MTTFTPYDPSANQKYLPIDPTTVKRVEIFPPFGIARVGDSEDEYYYGPEVPGSLNLASDTFGTFRDSKGHIKRQASISQLAYLQSVTS